MKYSFFILFFILCFKSNYARLNNDLPKKQKATRESILVKKAAINTLSWFFKVENKTQRVFDKFYIKGDEGDSTNPYRVDFDGVKEYFDYLKMTNLFSQNFFDDLLVYFKKCDSNFIAVKQYKKIPLGFERNLITKDMDDMGVEENLNKSSISSYKKIGNTVYLSLKFAKFYTYTFVLTKYHGKWLVDNINGAFPPLYSKPV